MAKAVIRGLLVALTFVAAFSNISCTVSITTGTGIATNTIPEGATSGAVITVVATESGGGTVNAFVVTSPTTDFEFATVTSGDLTVKSTATLDYETATTQVIVFTAALTGTATATGTLTVSITDINDKTPVVATITFLVADGAVASTTVGTVTATDADGTAANNVISAYAITGGNTDTMFAISTAGVITVDTGKTINSTALGGYALEVTATDSGTTPNALTGTGTVIIAVFTPSGAPLISGGIVSVAAMLMTIIYQFI